MRKNKKALRRLLAVLLAVGIIFGAVAIYASIYYEADEAEITSLISSSSVTMEEKDGFTAFTPRESTAVGFIFYPGGKVEHKAYYPLMNALAEYGILSIVVKMPLKLAVLNSNAADAVRAHYPEITDWYVGGHSLGGAMAASHASKNENSYKGVVLLGAYSTKDLSGTSLSVLSVYGSCDGVMNREKYDSCLENMPSDFTEIVIEGGSHAYFGAYGEQKGDGTATVSRAEQMYVTASSIYSFVTKGE